MKPVLSAADHELFLKDGYLVVKNAVPPETIAAALKMLEAGALQDRATGPVRKHQDIPEVAACVTPKIYQAVQELFGDAYPYDRHHRMTDKVRPYEPDSPWNEPHSHIDNDHPTIVPDVWAVAFFIFLTKVPPKCGGFIVFPGSANRYRLAMNDTPGILRVKDGVWEEKGKWFEFLAEPGDCMLFHHLLGHSSSTNTSSKSARHALLGRFGPDPRLDPGDKPFERMSTLEKANSTRYLREKLGFKCAEVGAAKGAAGLKAFAEGADLGGEIAVFDLIRFAGETVLFYALEAAPGELRRATTRDWANWTVAKKPVLSGAPLRSVAVSQTGFDFYLFAGLDDAAKSTKVLTSRDLASFKPASEIPGCPAAGPHVDIVSARAMKAGYAMVFSADPKRPNAAVVRRGQDWAAAGEWKEVSPVAEFPAGSEIRDLRVHPVWGENWMELVAELRGRDGAPRLSAIRSEDGERFDGPPTPLTFDAGEPPRQLRVYARARRYWLVGFARRSGGRARLFWGEIDWEKAPGAVRTIRTPEEFDRALQVVGLR